MSPKVRSLLFLSFPIVSVTLVSYYLQSVILQNQEEVTRWLAGFGSFIFLAYTVLAVISIVFPPLGGFVLLVAMIALFGPGVALTLAYLVGTPTYLLNFYLARRYGRPLVEKVMGKEALKKIDHYVSDAGTPTLIILRMIQGGNFDYLSYGYGLTKVSFKTFAIVNFLAGIPGILLSYLIFTRFENLTVGVLVLYGVTAVLAGVAISIRHYQRHPGKKIF